LTLETLKIPDLEETTATHTPGGGVLGIDIGMNVIEPLAPTFKLSGFDPQTLSLFGLGAAHRSVYTGYGAVRDKRTGKAIEAKTIIEARMTSIKPDEFKRGDLYGHDHVLKEVTRYELWFNGEEKFTFDFWTNTKRIGGVDQNSDTNRILRIS
jgi:P2 family phage contractile tail tube protein